MPRLTGGVSKKVGSGRVRVGIDNRGNLKVKKRVGNGKYVGINSRGQVSASKRLGNSGVHVGVRSNNNNNNRRRSRSKGAQGCLFGFVMVICLTLVSIAGIINAIF